MKKLKRRIVANIIDAFLVGFLIVIICLPIKNEVTFLICAVVLVLLFSLAYPLAFRSATVGMRIMKLKIVDKYNNKPSRRLILRRFVMYPRLVLKFTKENFWGVDNIDDWELEHLGTIIVVSRD